MSFPKKLLTSLMDVIFSVNKIAITRNDDENTTYIKGKNNLVRVAAEHQVARSDSPQSTTLR